MPLKVYAHIGLPKTGTTYLQQLLYANTEAFGAQGTTVIGNHRLHFDAGSEVAERRTPRLGEVPHGRWDRVLDEVAAARTEAVVFSNERYSLCWDDGIARIVDSFPGSELHVVVTVRDLVEAAPSAWQEHVKNGGRTSWEEYAQGWAADPDGDRSRVRRVLEGWPKHLPPDRIHVITAPRPATPRELIFERFCSVLDVDPSLMARARPKRRNASLDYPVTEMLRRLNDRKPGLDVATHKEEIKKWLADGVLERRPGPRPELTGKALAHAERESAWLRDTLRSGGFHVVGDLADLEEDSPPDPTTPQVDDAELLDVALEALQAMTRRSAKRGRKLRKLTKRRPDAASTAAVLQEQEAGSGSVSFAALVARLRSRRG